jgi:phage baseplate assembly protein W
MTTNRKPKNNDEYRQSGGNTDVFCDFLHTFLPHPNTGQITRRKNADSVKMALRNLVLTKKYERIHNPSFGSNITHSLFENLSESETEEVREEIEYTIKKYEPRVDLHEVVVSIDENNNALVAKVIFSVINFGERREELNLTISRVR